MQVWTATFVTAMAFIIAGCSGSGERSSTATGDGSKIAFDRLLENETDPNPDVQSSADTEVFVIDADGSGLTRITNTYAAEGIPQWSPDNTRLAYGTLESRLFVSDSDGSRRIELADNAYVDLFSWSPDGSMIVYSGFAPGKHVSDLWITKTNGSGTATIPVDGLRSVFDPVWSPDGEKIAFLGLSTGKHASTGLYVIDPEGGEPVMLVGGAPEDPVWSPDGTRIAFRRDRPRPGIYVVNGDGGGLRRLTDGKFDGEQVWSPDGSRIAFVRTRHWVDDAGDIYLVQINTGALRKLTSEPDSRAPTWSPDGTKIAFEGPDAKKQPINILQGGGEVYVMNADGSGRRIITHTGGRASDPVWSSGSGP